MFTDEELRQVDEIRSHYPTPLGAVMGLLHMLQDKYGHISGEAVTYTADLLGIPPENVLGVVSFYEMYHEHPTARFDLQVCTNVSCLLRGSDAVLEALRRRLGIGLGERTADGRFMIHEAECLGSCGTAPVLSLHKKYHENLTPEKVDALVDQLLQEAEQGGVA
jgi:NADH-quinone oxidoreductase subunit E